MVKQSFPLAKIKDLGIEIGTKEQIEWDTIKSDTEKAILKTKCDLALLEHSLPFINLKIAEEKDKLK